MTETPVPAAAVRIVAKALGDRDSIELTIEDVVTTLAREGWLHDPERVAELETELAKVKGHRAELAERCYRKDLELDAWRTGEAS